MQGLFRKAPGQIPARIVFHFINRSSSKSVGVYSSLHVLQIVRDVTDPTGSIVINADDVYTNVADVTITVTANDTLLTVISQVDPIWVPFNVSENDRLAIDRAVAAGRLALPKDNGYEVTVKLADGTAFPRAGRITFADTRVNPATGSYEMRAELPNRDLALKPGQFVRVQLKGALRRDAIAVPQSAVLDGPQGKFVYVPAKDKDGKDIALPRPITVGPWVEADGVNLWIVETGLAAGDKVIVDGIARLFAPGSPIVLGPPPGQPGAPGAPPAAPGKDDAKPAAPARS